MPNKGILFLLPYPLHRAPSQRFRVENLLFLLEGQNKSYTLAPFMTEETWTILYQNGGLLTKGISILKSYFKRLKTVLFEAYKYEYIFIHREAAPLGPPIFEWYLAKCLHKKIIYDFDDAIWIPNTSAQNKIASWFKSFWKIKYICKWSYKVAAGNDFLVHFAQQSGAKDILRIPTVVNTETRYNRAKQHQDKNIVVGWTGSHSTLPFINDILPYIAALQTQYDFTFLVIADKKPELALKNWAYCKWNPETEIDDLLKMDIGVMPLKNDAWSEGKCGFKLIQYLSLGIPAVANSVGVNKLIIEEGESGFLADDEHIWKEALAKLIEDIELRKKMGEKGREKMIQNFSIGSQKEIFLSLFQFQQKN